MAVAQARRAGATALGCAGPRGLGHGPRASRGAGFESRPAVGYTAS